MARNAHFTSGVAHRRRRFALCLILPALALLYGTLFTFNGNRGRAQNPAPRGVEVKTETAVTSVLRRVIFTTPAGNTIFVNLPEDLTPGETCSGTVFAEPSGRADASRSAAANEFRSYVVEIAGQKIPAAGKTFELTLTPDLIKGGALEVVLRGARGDVVGRAEIPVASRTPSRPGDVRLPAFVKSGDFLTVECPCDGVITDTDFVMVGGTKILTVAESQGQRVAFNNSLGIGPAEVEFNERGQSTKGRINNLGIKLSVLKKEPLKRGERTTLTVEVTGLEDLSEPAPLRLENTTPGIVTMEPANVQQLSIGRADVQRGGRYTAERTLTGIQTGTFHIDGTVSRDVQRAPAGRGEPGVAATPVLVAPPVAAGPRPEVAVRFEGGQDWVRLRDELTKKIQEGNFPPPPSPEVVLVSPEVGATVSEAPTFRWRRLTEVPGDVQKVYYTLRVFEVLPEEQSRAEEIRKNKPLFEQSQLTEESFRLPAGRAALTPGKIYAWSVTATDLGGRELARSKLALFPLGPWPPFNFCWIFDPGPISYCVGQGAGITVAHGLFLGGGSAITWTLTPQNSADPPVSGTSGTVTIPPSLLPTTPGPHTYNLTITNGSCTRSMPITVYAHPGGAVGGTAVVSPAQICDGGTAVLDVTGETGNVGQWQYSDDNGSTWNSATTAFYIAGAPANTNQMSPTSCAAPNWYTDRKFRAVVSTSSAPNAPSCSSQLSAPTTLRIWCKPQAGSVTASTTRYCKYSPPPNITLQMTGTVIGNITWHRNPGGPITGTGNQITITPAPTQTTTYWATVSTGGSCPDATSNSVTVIVDDQPFCTSSTPLSVDKNLLCPGDAATLTVSSCTGYVSWYQSPTGLPGSWGAAVSAGNMVQNTTDLFATTFWQAVISGPPGSGSTCPPITTNTVAVNMMTPPAAPVVATPGPACLGSNVTLTTSLPPAGVTYQWYHDDLPISCGGGATCTFPAEPGTYWVEASNGCQTVQSNFVTLPVEEITIKLVAPCCRTTGPVTLSATATSSLTGPIPAGYFTWYQGTTVVGTGTSITVNPNVTSVYCVSVKSPTVSCAVQACTTITVCP
jgi:hypothetical protein